MRHRKYLFFFSFLLGSAMGLHAQSQSKYIPSKENIEARKEFTRDRFGIFIHWGIYSLFGQGEWYLHNSNVLSSEYAKAANAFYPHDYHPKKWIAAIKNSGAKYITFTTRHHDGFSMWHTKESPYNIKNTPYKKDILKSLVHACQQQGIKVHLYYSHLDWSRYDYPLGRTGGKSREKNLLKPNYASYLSFMKQQLKELLTSYGKIDAIWFDGWWDHDYDSTFDWKLKEQYDFIHQLQPGCLIANNHHTTPFDGEDIQVFERDVPGENKAGLSGQSISQLPLETCQTMNGMWGYKIIDQNYKNAHTLVSLLETTAAKGANLLLNIGPQPDGNLPASAIAKLDSIGIWMKYNDESIYGTNKGESHPEEGYVTTTKDKTTYLHILKPKTKEMTLPIPYHQIKSIQILSTKDQIQFEPGNDTNRTNLSLPPINYTNNVLKIEYY